MESQRECLVSVILSNEKLKENQMENQKKD